MLRLNSESELVNVYELLPLLVSVQHLRLGELLLVVSDSSPGVLQSLRRRVRGVVVADVHR